MLSTIGAYWMMVLPAFLTAFFLRRLAQQLHAKQTAVAPVPARISQTD